MHRRVLHSVHRADVTNTWPVIIVGLALANIAPRVGMSMIWLQIIINNAIHIVFFHRGDKATYNPGVGTNRPDVLPNCEMTIVMAAWLFPWWDWVLSLVLVGGLSAFLCSKTRGRLRTVPICNESCLRSLLLERPCPTRQGRRLKSDEAR